MVYSAKANKGLLLLHTGSPAAPEPAAVAPYLRRFLMDPFVLEMPRMIRALLVHGIIVPFRARKSAEKYRRIWTDAGSPLQVHTDAFARALGALLPGWSIETASAYSVPFVSDGVRALCTKKVEEIIVFPLFPHDAGATRGSLKAMVQQALEELKDEVPPLVWCPAFYDRAEYLEAMAALCCPALEAFHPDHVLFSYHGLPLKQAHRAPSEGGALTYEEQSEAGTRLLARYLGLSEENWSLAYQSRFGKGWLEPSTGSLLLRLLASGKKRVALIAPSFVADCLETLEELDEELRVTFLQSGGDALLRIPSLNAHPAWIRGAAELICRPLPQ
ncbi:MAG TPA: ferrochelatase [Candidatus Hydrogenedentes bacterium]|nr:ferrochelatase [Candidatus Hydrogenedentota bacterium]